MQETHRAGQMEDARADIPSAERFVAPVHVISVSRGDTTVLVDALAGQYFTLNAVGGRVWALASTGASLDAIAAALAAEYTVDIAVATRDARSLLTSLRDEHLLDQQPTPAPMATDRSRS